MKIKWLLRILGLLLNDELQMELPGIYPYLPTLIAKNEILYQLFQKPSLLARADLPKTKNKCKSSESSANHSISRLSLHSSESNGVSKNPFGQPGVLVSFLSLLSKQTLPARDCVTNQPFRQRGSLRSDSEALMAFRFTIFCHLPF